MSFREIVFAMVMSGIVGLWIYAYIVSEVGDIRRILWDNTMLAWTVKKLFGEKKKVKQAPINVNPSWYVPASAPPPPARRLTAMKAAPKAFSTSSLNVPSMNHIGKTLVIQNWDRLAGMMIPMITNPNFNGHNWIVTRAGQTTDGYECMFENSGVFGNSNRAVTLTVYNDMYDSHRVLVKCGGRMSTMNIDTFKDPNNMLYTIANEFQEKFR
jgi:hypothetical protein